MSLNVIPKLKALIEKGGPKKKIEAYEDVIVEEIEEFIGEESFFELPTNEILKIIGKSENEDVEFLCELISKMSENKGEESTLLLNVIKKEEATLEECIEILSKFEHCPLCQRLGEVFNEYKEMPRIDYKYENGELREKI